MKIKLITLILFVILVILTVIITVSANTNADNIQCKEFEETVLWSSLYSISDNSIDYSVWDLKYKCPGLNCFIKNIEVYVRTLQETNHTINGNFKISDPTNTDCTNPTKSTYDKYVAFIGQRNRELSYSWECGSQQTKNICELSYNDGYNSDCYTIMGFASSEILLDIFKVKYVWCWEENSINFNESILKESNLEEPIIDENNKSSNKSSKTALIKFIFAILLIITLIVILKKSIKFSRRKRR